VREIERADAEAALFGARAEAEPEEATAEAPPEAVDPFAALRGTRARQEALSKSSYDPKQLAEGVVLNIAVLVHDEKQLPQTLKAIEAAGKAAGLPLKAISWQTAAGVLGQFATLMQAVLFAAVLIIFVVALVVINNALVMATLERVREIGTLRAIGAQRRFILVMLVLESIVIGLASGATGALIGGAILLVLGRVGIPAVSDVMTFFFSGPRLYPTVGARELLFAMTSVLIVSVISGIYPAWLAMRVSPREAMGAED
jgi:ABC-type lipoprotein release transport system permease subunit